MNTWQEHPLTALYFTIGITLHRALALPVEKGGPVEYAPLSPRQLQRFRRTFGQLKLFIIDEFSFLSYEALRCVDLRFQDIFRNEEVFGNMNMLLVGMFPR